MTAASLILEKRRMNVKKIEKSKAVNEDITCLYSQIGPKKDIKVGGASSKEQGLVSRIRPNVSGKPSPMIYLKILRRHSPHQ